jgi:hypothetical protein
MTDLATAGSVVADAPPAGTPATPPATTENGSAVVVETPFSGLSEGTRKWVETKGYKSVEDAISGGMNAESRLGTAISLPADDASAEEWNEKVFSRLPEAMRPITSPDKVEYKRPEGLPENLPYSEELANASKTWAAEAGASPKVAQAYHDKFVGYMAEQAQAQQVAIAQSVEKTADDLVKDWGPMDSDGFKEKLTVANRAMKELGLVDAYKAKGILLPDGSLTDPQIARAFQAIGDAMFREDTINADGVVTGENPFKRDAKGQRNVTAISALVKSDPERAKRLAREAGENPDQWMPNNPR